jgi:hypothetical protein
VTDLQALDFVLLRPAGDAQALVDRGDLDVLGTDDAVRAALARLAARAAGGALAYEVRRETADKTALALLTTDLAHALRHDLWVEIPQLVGVGHGLVHADVRRTCTRDGAGWLRMPAPLELALYLQHLWVRRKPLGLPQVVARLTSLGAAAHAAGAAALAEHAAALARGEGWTDARLQCATRVTREALGRPRPGRSFTRQLRRIGRAVAWRAVPGGRGVIVLAGADGSGKTTLAETLAREPGAPPVLVGKSLYRTSLVFRLVYRVERLLGGRTPERIDERWAVLAFLVALARLRAHVARAGGRVILDRHLMDFLYVGRKSDRPRFVRGAVLLGRLAARIPVVHLAPPHAVLAARKDEVGAPALAAYDRDMARQHTRYRSVDYLRFPNAGRVDDAAGALRAYFALRGVWSGR